MEIHGQANDINQVSFKIRILVNKCDSLAIILNKHASEDWICITASVSLGSEGNTQLSDEPN